MNWDWLAAHAQIATATIALSAFGFAWWSLSEQKRLARKRAAIDVFLKTEMDSHLRDAYEAYRDALAPMNRAPTVEDFSLNHRKKYQAIRTYLDINELISVGINNKVFDERVCHGFWSAVLTDICRDADKVIVHARQQPHGGRAYDQLIKVNARWVGPRHFWQWWRDGD